MRLSQLQKKKYISEGWNDPAFLLLEQKTIQPWLADIEKYVVEANLSKEQITQLFTTVEKGADDAGRNRTAIGKGKDIAALPIEAVKFINNKINELGRAAKETGPVKNIDAKFAELKTKIGEKDSKVVSAVKAVSDWAKENPGKATLAVAVLTTAAAMTTGPFGGAVAGFLARATKDLLQGEDLSTAVGKSAKTAAIGALIGMASEYIAKDEIEAIASGGAEDIANQVELVRDSNLEDSLAEMPDKVAAVWDKNPNLEAYTSKVNLDITFGTGYGASYSGVIQQDQVDQLNELIRGMNSAKAEFGTFSNELNTASVKYVEYMRSLTDTNRDLNMAAEYLKDAKDLTDAQLEVIAASKESLVKTVQQVQQAAEVGTAAAQGAATAGIERKTSNQESVVIKGQKLSEGQIYLLFNKITQVNNHMLENKLMFESIFDAVTYYNRQTVNEAPGILKKAAGAIGKGVGALKKAGRNLTAKVTADKLMKAWTKAGEPTDSNEIADKVLKPAGVADDVIKGTYDAMKIDVPTSTSTPTGDADAPAADADTATDTAADTTTDTPAGDAEAPAGDAEAPTGDAEAPTGDTATSSADPATGDATLSKDERYYLQKNTKDETKVDIIDKQTSKPIKNGVALAPEKAEPMSDKMNKEAGKYAGAEGDKFIMQPNAQNPKTYDVLDTQTDQPVQNGAALQPGEAEELRDKMNSQTSTSTATDTTATNTTTTDKPAADGATDANTASTSGDQGADATTTPQDDNPAVKDTTGAEPSAEEPYQRPDRTQGQKDYKPTQTTPAAPVNMGDLVVSIKNLKPEVQAIIKKELSA